MKAARPPRRNSNGSKNREVNDRPPGGDSLENKVVNNDSPTIRESSNRQEETVEETTTFCEATHPDGQTGSPERRGEGVTAQILHSWGPRLSEMT